MSHPESTKRLSLHFSLVLLGFSIVSLVFPIHAFLTNGKGIGYFIPVVFFIPAVILYWQYTVLDIAEYSNRNRRN